MVKIVLPPCQPFVSACVSVPLEPSCHEFRQYVRRRFPPICGFGSFRYCYVYHKGLHCYKTQCGCVLSAGFGIAVKYVDCKGNKKSRSFEDSIIFRDCIGNFDRTHSNVRFTNLTCDIDCNGNVVATFMAELCS